MRAFSSASTAGRREADEKGRARARRAARVRPTAARYSPLGPSSSRLGSVVTGSVRYGAPAPRNSQYDPVRGARVWRPAPFTRNLIESRDMRNTAILPLSRGRASRIYRENIAARQRALGAY